VAQLAYRRQITRVDNDPTADEITMARGTLKLRPSCADERDPVKLTVPEARQRILDVIDPLSLSERIALRQALDRVLAEPVISSQDVPAHTNAAMDGYAVRGTDLPSEGEVALALIGEAYAGHPFAGRVSDGQCVRIMTGAPLPEGADTVLMQERAQRAGGQVQVGPGHRPGENVRQAGEDIARGSVVLEPGRRLTPADLGLIASLGIPEVLVRRRPRVAFVSTGDELRSVGQPLGPGEIYDSNRYTLHGMLQHLGAEIIDLGVVRDDIESLRRALSDGAKQADVVITSGGVSVGEADFVKQVLGELGRAEFWQIAMKPGRPLTFGRLSDALFFGLPGNPVAVMVTFYQFVQPALTYLAGGRAEPPRLIRATCQSRVRKKPGRTEFQRGVLEHEGNGELRVTLTGKQGSGILSSMSRANCFIVLPHEAGSVEPGDTVLVQPFDTFV
jgi:molybdopterin molybdotransferase